MPFRVGSNELNQHAGNVQAAPSPGQRFMGQFWNAYQQGVINPQIAAGNNQIAGLQTQQQIGAAQSGMQQQQLQQQYGYDQQRLGLQQQGLDLSRGQLDRQSALLPQQNALQNQLFDIQSGQIGRGQANADAGYGSALAGLHLQGEQLQNQYSRGTQQAMGSSAAAGATNTAGYRQALTDLSNQLSYGQRGLALQEGSTTRDYESQKAQLGDQSRFLDINRQQNDLGYKEQQAQLRDQQKQLDIQAQGLGVSGGELSARLNSAIRQIGLQNQLTASQVAGEIAKIKNGQYSILSNVIPVLSQFTGLNLTAG